MSLYFPPLHFIFFPLSGIGHCSVSHSTSFCPNSFASKCSWQPVAGLIQGDFRQTISTGPSPGCVSDILWSPRVRVIFLLSQWVRARFYLSSRLPHTFPPSASPRITGLYLCACSLQAAPLPQTVCLSAGQALKAEATAALSCGPPGPEFSDDMVL